MTAPLATSWVELLGPASLEVRLGVMLELSRAGVLSAVGLDLRTASIMAANISAPGTWQSAEAIVNAAFADDGWSEWTRFCAESEGTQLADYRTLLEERYER